MRNPAEPLRILLIKGDHEDADRIQPWINSIEKEGYRIHRASGPEDAIQRISAVNVDLILLVADPEEKNLARSITTLCTFRPDIPVVVVGRTRDEEVGSRALKAGAQDYLKIDFPLKALNRVLGSAIERQDDKDRLARSEQFLRATLDALSNHIAILDEAGGIIAVNQAWRDFAKAAHTRPEAVGEGVNYLEVCDTATGRDADLARAFASGIRDVIQGRTSSYEMEYPCHSDEEERWFLGQVTSFPARIHPRRIVVSHLNITQRVRAENEKRRLEEHLRNSQKLEAIGTLAGGIAHDFNNILSAVIGYTDLALEQIESFPQIREDLEEVAKAGRRAKDLVAQLLSFSRQANVEPAPIQVYLLIKEALKLMRAALPSSISIEEEILSFGEVMADPGQIHQLVMNLCTNAYSAMRENGGVLRVRLDEVDLDPDAAAAYSGLGPGRCMRLAVSDTGIGMDDQTKSRIFDPYFTTKEKGESAGLGLSVVYGIAKAHGGGISVESRPGEGTSFTVLLPLMQRPEMTDTETEPAAQGTGERILFIDDEPVLLRMVKQMLGKSGYRVDAMNGSVKALAHLKENPKQYDLVISDMTMPGLAGDQLAREILSIRPDLPVILCTGYSDRIDKNRAQSLGVRALVMKPFTCDELTRVVRKTLDGHPQ